MAWNGSGTFSRLYNWVTDRDAGVKIQATRMDGEDDGFAAGINACLAKNGENAATANLNLGGFRYTNAGTPTALTDLSTALYAKSAGASTSLVTSGGTANAQTVTNSLSYTALTAGIVQWFIPGNANTGSCTLAVDGLTAKNIFAYGAALLGGELQTNVPALVKYDGTQWNLLNPNDATGSFTITLTGMTAGTTGTVSYRIVRNKTVHIYLASSITGTSNTNNMTGTGVPSVLQVTTGSRGYWVALTDNGGTIAGAVTMAAASGTWTFRAGINTAGFTTSGTKGLSQFCSFSYNLD